MENTLYVQRCKNLDNFFTKGGIFRLDSKTFEHQGTRIMEHRVRDFFKRVHCKVRGMEN